MCPTADTGRNGIFAGNCKYLHGCCAGYYTYLAPVEHANEGLDKNFCRRYSDTCDGVRAPGRILSLGMLTMDTVVALPLWFVSNTFH
jgi:hypothetical protein